MRYGDLALHDNYGNAVVRAFHSCVPNGTLPYREHHHTECELSIFMAGRGLYRVKEKTYEFEPGDVFLFGSDEAHCITEIYEPLDLLNVHFEPRLIWEDPNCIEILRLFNGRNERFSNKFSHEDKALSDFLIGIEREMKEKNFGYAIKVKYSIFSAFVHILRNYDYVNNEDVAVKATSVIKNLKKAMQYIDENLESPLSLNDISAEACMAPTYFSAVFKKFNGISPWDYITIKRVEKAKEMLRTTEMTKLEIAERCGFTSSSNFYKMFTRVTGKKPGDYSRT